MGKVFAQLGMTTGVVYPFQPDEEKRAAYAADVTYATNNELGFDYLRDNMKGSLAEMTQRGHFFAIVDEVDSILIDEARTPLIISGPSQDRSDLYKVLDGFMPELKPDHYKLDEKTRNATFTEEGNEFLEQSPASRRASCPRGRRCTIPNRRPSSTTPTRACARTSCSTATSNTSCATARWCWSTNSPAA